MRRIGKQVKGLCDLVTVCRLSLIHIWLLIAQAVLADPKILVLDEPTAGLDPKQRIAIRNLIAEISAGKIVLIATHVVTDVESAANRILLIREGELLADSTREELTASLAGQVWEIRIPESELGAIEKREDFLLGNISREGETLFVRLISEHEPEGLPHKMCIRDRVELRKVIFGAAICRSA